MADANLPTAVIVCSREKVGEWLAVALATARRFARVYWCNPEVLKWSVAVPESARVTAVSPSEKVPPQVAAAFVHTGLDDPAHWTTSGVRAGRVFTFSTGGDPPANADEYPIYRRIVPREPGAAPLSDPELDELCDFVLGRREEVPEVCRRLPALDMLIKLSVLSQGYLAAHADPRTGQPELDRLDDVQEAREICAAALERMGWVQYAAREKNGAAVPPELRTLASRGHLRSQVRRPDWWRTTLGPDPTAQVRTEWGGQLLEQRKRVEALLAVINDDRGEIRPSTVAQAYLAIAQRLVGK
jgi:hypothetical protein